MIELDPADPVLWRDERHVQIGIARPVCTLEDPPAWQLELLRVLAHGVAPGQIAGLATALGGDPSDAAALVSRLGAALREVATVPEVSLLVTERVPHAAVLGVYDALADTGFAPVRRTASEAARLPEAIAVIVSTSLVPPHLVHELVAADIVHVPLVLDSESAVVGPAVRPGETACLACLWAHETDRDPAWPTLASQLIGRTLVDPPTRSIAGSAASLVARVLAGVAPASGRSRSVEVSRDGRRRWRSHALHAECLCRSRPGTATAIAPPDPWNAPTTATASVRHE
jgi:hypothetical protein